MEVVIGKQVVTLTSAGGGTNKEVVIGTIRRREHNSLDPVEGLTAPEADLSYLVQRGYGDPVRPYRSGGWFRDGDHHLLFGDVNGASEADLWNETKHMKQNETCVSFCSHFLTQLKNDWFFLQYFFYASAMQLS